MEEKTPRLWLGLAFAALIAQPASAQNYRRNFVKCTKELGLQADPSYALKLQSEPGRVFPKRTPSDGVHRSRRSDSKCRTARYTVNNLKEQQDASLFMLPLPPPHCRKGSPNDVALINGQTIILWLLIRCDNAKLFVALRNDSDAFAFA